jgi:hypothetical protein
MLRARNQSCCARPYHARISERLAAALGHHAANNASSAAGRSPETPVSGQNAHGVNWLVSIAPLSWPALIKNADRIGIFAAPWGDQANAWDVLSLT